MKNNACYNGFKNISRYDEELRTRIEKNKSA